MPLPTVGHAVRLPEDLPDDGLVEPLIDGPSASAMRDALHGQVQRARVEGVFFFATA